MARLFRLLNKEGLTDKWRKAVYHTTPSEQRKVDKQQAEQKLQKSKFRILMGAILQRKERYSTLYPMEA